VKEWLVVASEHAVVVIDALALIVIAVGTIHLPQLLPRARHRGETPAHDWSCRQPR
jgi:hypothetical protein